MARFIGILAVTTCLAQIATTTLACPFCTAEQSTLTEELASVDVALFGKLLEPAPEWKDSAVGQLDPDGGKAKFSVAEVMFGQDKLGDIQKLEAIYYGDPDKQATYLLKGLDEPLDWQIPLRLSEKAVDYVKQLRGLPESGGERILFFQDFLQHEDPMLAQDAYDEFARASYKDVKSIKDKMNREQLLAWIGDSSVSPNRRRLFLTMLGVCGTEADIAPLQAMLTSDSRVLLPAIQAMSCLSQSTGGPFASLATPEAFRLAERRKKLGLDAMIACYLTLRGEQGMDVIDQRFLSGELINGKSTDYSHVYSALMALRFLAEEENIIPVDRVLASARLLLDNEDFADQVIPDLARWEDWSVLDRLTQMYRDAGVEGTGVLKYVREPIITYLDVAKEQSGDVGQQATEALASIESIDPEAVRRARSLRAFGALAGALKRKPAGLEAIGEEPLVLATDVPSTEPPDPAEFANLDELDQDDDPASETTDSPPAEELASETDTADKPGDASPDEPVQHPQTPEASKAVAVARPAPQPPNRTLLIVAPTLAGAVCFGLFWAILRGGAA